MRCGVIRQNTVASSLKGWFSSDVSWSILTRLRQTCQNQTCQRRFRDCAGSGIVPVHELCRVYIEQISLLDEKIGGLDKEIQHRAKTDEGTSRLMTISGVGPMCATPFRLFHLKWKRLQTVWNAPLGVGCCRDKNRPVGAKSCAKLDQTLPNLAGLRKWGGGIVDGY